jgi:hypothetical protein
VCFAISMETDASNFCLPGGHNEWCRLPFPGRQAADHTAMMLPKLQKIGKAALRPACKQGILCVSLGRVRRIGHVSDAAEQHQNMGRT